MFAGKEIRKHVQTTAMLVVGCKSTPYVAYVLQHTHLGVLTSTMSLLIGLASRHTEDYESLVPYVIHVFGMLVFKMAWAREYLHCRTPSPWLQIKLLKFLQLYPNVVMEDTQKDSSTAAQTPHGSALFHGKQDSHGDKR